MNFIRHSPTLNLINVIYNISQAIQYKCIPGLPFSFLSWAYVRHGFIFGVWYAGGIDFWRFRTPGLLESTNEV